MTGLIWWPNCCDQIDLVRTQGLTSKPIAFELAAEFFHCGICSQGWVEVRLRWKLRNWKFVRALKAVHSLRVMRQCWYWALRLAYSLEAKSRLEDFVSIWEHYCICSTQRLGCGKCLRRLAYYKELWLIWGSWCHLNTIWFSPLLVMEWEREEGLWIRPVYLVLQ